MSSAEIAFLLGFSDPKSFVRAFRDWTGFTPAQHRSMMLA
jgi:AraC-like DNA-binding protein